IQMALPLSKALYFVANVRGTWGIVLLRLGLRRQTTISLDSYRFSSAWISNPGRVHRGRIELQLSRDTVSFVHGGRKFRLYYGSIFQLRESIRSIVGIFYNDLYRFPAMDGTIVFDVGASVGDSTLYLAPYAKRIYAVEPYPYSYTILRRNIAINGLSSKVTAINAAVSDTSGRIELSTGRVSGITAFLAPSGSGTGVRVMTLGQLASLYKGTGKLSLKLNCLGYEDRIILNSSPKDLARFSSMVVYTEHKGYSKLASRLSRGGFRVRVSKTRGRDQVLIFAVRRGAA
ncbi:MAG: FkbM family methyltransferase, partial [Candidatus Micrarchaeota archaeon]|nr:FkbM family methyltransferase [Candidatus Micrarchaeota archaeon]